MNRTGRRAGVALVLFSAGCLTANPPDGALLCSTRGECPPGYLCAPSGSCFHKATSSSITQVGSATVAGNPSGVVNATLPSGWMPGDFLLSYVASLNAESTCPVFWTEIFNVSGQYILHACGKAAQAGEPNPNVGPDSIVETIVAVLAFRGVDAMSPWDAAMGQAGPISPSVTTLGSNELLVFGVGAVYWPTAVNPIGTQPLASGDDGMNGQVAVSSLAAASAGATPAETWGFPGDTSHPNSGAVSGTVALRPASH
jgi:hypothetical protein